jgi:hypothetical protein
MRIPPKSVRFLLLVAVRAEKSRKSAVILKIDLLLVSKYPISVSRKSQGRAVSLCPDLERRK